MSKISNYSFRIKYAHEQMRSASGAELIMSSAMPSPLREEGVLEDYLKGLAGHFLSVSENFSKYFRGIARATKDYIHKTLERSV
jgi:hypothetical protein